MVQISFLGATAVLVGVAAARPQGPGGGGPVIPCNQVMKYRYVKWGPAKKTDPQIVSGETCVNQGNAPTDPRCSSTHTVSHSVGITKTVGGGLSGALQLEKIFTLGVDVSASVSWSTDDTNATGVAEPCPLENAACGLQLQYDQVTITGEAQKTFSGGINAVCPKDSEWEKFTIIAPAKRAGASDKDNTITAFYEACLQTCLKPGSGGQLPDQNDLSCKDAAAKKNVPVCPGAQPPPPPPKDNGGYKKGWCTGHLTQYTKGHDGEPNYSYSVDLLDADKKNIGHTLRQAADANGHMSMTSQLPFTLEIQSGNGDDDAVTMSYGDQSWICDGKGDHDCTLGSGKHNGWEDGGRQGDFGVTC